MEFNVVTDDFNGPLDLMLHLIKENKMDIYDLDISLLLEQYLSYIRYFQSINLENVSEYLVELAILIEYKSKKILPLNKEEIEEDFIDEKERLVKRLLEYQKYKEASTQLELVYNQRLTQFAKPLTINEEWILKNEDINIDGNPYDLIKAMNKCLKRLKFSKPLETRLTQKETSLEDRVLYIKSKFSKLPKIFKFEDLIDDCSDKNMVIITFLAILDLIRLHKLYFNTEEEDIYFYTGGNSGK